jgi:hypothetical protein
MQSPRMPAGGWRHSAPKRYDPQSCDGPTDRRQETEVAIAADVLNRMLDLGRPEYVRIA